MVKNLLYFFTMKLIATMIIGPHLITITNIGNLFHHSMQWVVLFDGFMVEAKWLATDQVPTAEDYLRNGVVTSGVPLAFVHLLVLLGYDQSTEALIDHIPSVISCPAKILRLWDDMGSA
jgi:(3S)-linalool synthase